MASSSGSARLVETSPRHGSGVSVAAELPLVSSSEQRISSTSLPVPDQPEELLGGPSRDLPSGVVLSLDRVHFGSRIAFAVC